jgi:hypothetical protein
MIMCACGCGATFPRLDNEGRERSFVNGHNSKNKPSPSIDKVGEILAGSKVPMTRQAIVRASGMRGTLVTATLQRMKVLGKVVHVDHNQWAAPRGKR